MCHFYFTEKQSDWTLVEEQGLRLQGHRLKVAHRHDVVQMSWHAKGDYIAAVYGAASTTGLIIHQLSLRRSQVINRNQFSSNKSVVCFSVELCSIVCRLLQAPFSKFGAVISRVLFHPTRPHLFVATQTVLRVYNLVKQELHKKLLTNCKFVSSIAVHPKGKPITYFMY